MKKLFAVIGTFFANLFNGVENFVTKHVTPSIEVVTFLRNALNGKVADILVNLIPTNYDNVARDFLVKTLSKAIDAAQISTDILNEPDDFSRIVKLIQHLKTLSKPMQKAILFKLASEYTKVSANEAGEAVPKGSIVDSLVQLEFAKTKHNELFNSIDFKEGGEAPAAPKPAKKAAPQTPKPPKGTVKK